MILKDIIYTDLSIIISLIWFHFMGDFLFQTDSMAQNKSKSNKWLGIHVLTYMVPFILFGPLFMFINGAAHFVIDWCTSRITSYLWKKNDRHNFFVVIGLDQALHMTTLILTYVWIVK